MRKRLFGLAALVVGIALAASLAILPTFASGSPEPAADALQQPASDPAPALPDGIFTPDEAAQYGVQADASQLAEAPPPKVTETEPGIYVIHLADTPMPFYRGELRG